MVISVQNAEQLAQTGELSFTPWEQVLALAWTPDGHFLAASAGNSIYIIRSPELEIVHKLELGSSSPGLAVSPDGHWLAVGSSDGWVRLIDVDVASPRYGDVATEFLAHRKGVNAVAFHPNGMQLISGGNDAVARVWDVASGEELAQWIGGTFAVSDVVFSQDGNALLIVNGALVRERKADGGQFLNTYQAEQPIMDIDESLGGRWLAAGDILGQVQVWDRESGEWSGKNWLGPEMAPAASRMVWQVGFNPAGDLLVSTHSDGMLHIWDVESGHLLGVLDSHGGPVAALAFQPDGRRIASGGLDGILRLWSVP